MIAAPEIELAYPLTDGEIAVNNLHSARQQSWRRFWRDPVQQGVAESVIELEQLALQFLSDSGALDRLESMVHHLANHDAESPRTAFILAQVASTTHRFSEARTFLERASRCVDLADAAHRLLLTIDQACAERLDSVLAARLQMAGKSGRLEDLVPLAALYADLREFEEADRIYQRAFRDYRDASPFPVAWVCFQLGALWGELVPTPLHGKAAVWYRRAIEILPCNVKARVHLAEIYIEEGRPQAAETLLMPALTSGDPEVNWRLAGALAAMGKEGDAEVQMQAARVGFESLLDKHLLAFADHGAEFYAGTGNDARRAFELASINVANRPTPRAFQLAHETALAAHLPDVAAEILAASTKRWSATIDLVRLALLDSSTIPVQQPKRTEESHAYGS